MRELKRDDITTRAINSTIKCTFVMNIKMIMKLYIIEEKL